MAARRSGRTTNPSDFVFVTAIMAVSSASCGYLPTGEESWLAWAVPVSAMTAVFGARLYLRFQISLLRRAKEGRRWLLLLVPPSGLVLGALCGLACAGAAHIVPALIGRGDLWTMVLPIGLLCGGLVGGAWGLGASFCRWREPPESDVGEGVDRKHD